MASDAISLEVYLPKESYSRNGERMGVPGVFLHKYWLGNDCLRAIRLGGTQPNMPGKFAVASHLNMPGCVSSPPNCIAIF